MPLFAGGRGRASLLKSRATAGRKRNATHWETPSPGPRLRSTTGSSRPDHAVPLLENHLRRFFPWKVFGFIRQAVRLRRPAGAILHYVRTTQRGTLHHVRPHRLLRAARLPGTGPRSQFATSKLVEPLFSGEDGGHHPFPFTGCHDDSDGQSAFLRRLDAAPLARPRPEIQARLDAVEAWSRDTIVREDLRRPLQNVPRSGNVC